MTTEKITLTDVPVQLTSGSETAYVSCPGSHFCFADSAAAPTELTTAHVDSKVSINPPFQIWAWSLTGDVQIIVSKQSA